MASSSSGLFFEPFLKFPRSGEFSPFPPFLKFSRFRPAPPQPAPFFFERVVICEEFPLFSLPSGARADTPFGLGLSPGTSPVARYTLFCAYDQGVPSQSLLSTSFLPLNFLPCTYSPPSVLINLRPIAPFFLQVFPLPVRPREVILGRFSLFFGYP